MFLMIIINNKYGVNKVSYPGNISFHKGFYPINSMYLNLFPSVETCWACKFLFSGNSQISTYRTSLKHARKQQVSHKFFMYHMYIYRKQVSVNYSNDTCSVLDVQLLCISDLQSGRDRDRDNIFCFNRLVDRVHDLLMCQYTSLTYILVFTDSDLFILLRYSENTLRLVLFMTP